jgi:DNA-binding MarR family transcriptional regulator
MVNEAYEPAEMEEEILDLLKNGRGTGDPWGHTTPAHLRNELDIKEGNESYHLRQLESAGWIEKVARGFYRFRADPREE